MILVFGKTGQVARELATLSPNGIFLDRDIADLSNPRACSEAIRAYKPTVVINAAAYTAVDKAEEEEELAQVVNGDAPGEMARACAARNIPFIHISTDYVFDGAGDAPFRPDHPTGPLGAYGRSKLAGEEAVRAAGGTYAILRTSWVFSAHGSNFVKTMLRLSQTRDALNIVEDQIGGPTPADDIATACLTIADTLLAEPEKSGVYHFSGYPDVSWKEFAETIFSKSGMSVSVTGIPTSAYPTPAKRPLNSRMSCEATKAAFGIARPNWHTGLRRVLFSLVPA